MTTTRVLPALLAVLLAVVGCGSKRLTDEQYQELCYAYSKGQVIGRGDAVAVGYAVDYMHLSRKDAADAVDTARREYCP
jgi:hypothetical protein